MIHETIGKIEARLRTAGAINDPTRTELLRLLATLEDEVDELARTHAEHAQSIAGFAALSTHEVTRDEKRPELVALSLRGLTLSVEGFEQSHPRLVQVVNAICTALANVGI